MNTKDTKKDALEKFRKDRHLIAEKINSQAFSDAVITVVQRAETQAMIRKKDYYITTVENGIAFFDEEEYNKFLDKTLFDLRKYLATKELKADELERQVDSYAANLVLHYIDYKLFTEEQITECKKQLGIEDE